MTDEHSPVPRSGFLPEPTAAPVTRVAESVTRGARTVDTLAGPAGRLEAIFNPGAPDARHAVVLCHPHPLYGGTMHNKVVYHAMRTFQAAGLPVLRFNFRGAGASQGSHDGGRGEQDDVRAALDWVSRTTGLPLLGAGFSFGAHMVFRVGCPDPRVEGLVGLGLPIAAGGRIYSYEFLAACPKPKLVIVGSEDIYAPRAALDRALSANPALALASVDGADHFFVGHLPRMQEHLESWLSIRFLSEPSSAGRTA